MSYVNLSGINIRRAAVRGVQLDGIAARRSTELLLSKMPDNVPGMSATAVLCVREMSVHVQSRARYVKSGSSILGAEMERIARQAVRPAHGPVPPNAEAVVFADRAELLSCLARDYVRHLLLQGWWWRVLLPGPSLVAAAMQLWVDEAAHVPSALLRLARTQDAVAFVRSMGEAEAHAVVQAMVCAHGLALLTEDTKIALQLQSNIQLISPALAKAQAENANTAQRTLELKIHAALPEAWAPGLNLAQRRLLAVGLSLARLSGLVRGAAFAQALPVLLTQACTQAVLIEQGVPLVANRIIVEESPLSNLLPIAGERKIVHSPENVIGADKQRVAKSASISLDSSFALASPPDEALASVIPRVALRTGSVLEMNAASEKPATNLASSLLDGKSQVVETAYGGVFFLCNAALALALYADFTRPLDRGLELSIWDFLALAAVDLGGPVVRHDPLWALLAELGGRKPGARPGAGFEPPHEWHIPEDWLLPFASDTGDWIWEIGRAHV